MTTSGDDFEGDSVAEKEQDGSQPLGVPAELGELRATVASLTRVVMVSLGLGVLLLAALNVYLYSQGRVLSHQANELGRQVGEITASLQEYETNTVPWMDRVSVELQKYGATHSEFAPIMGRYFRTNAPAQGAAGRPGR